MLNVTSPPIFQFVHLSLILILTGSTMLIACNKGADNKKKAVRIHKQCVWTQHTQRARGEEKGQEVLAKRVTRIDSEEG